MRLGTGPAVTSPGAEQAAAPVWVLDDPLAEAPRQATAIAARLGVEFRQIAPDFLPAAWAALLARHGALWGLRRRGGMPAAAPRLVIAAGPRALAPALWLKRHHGCIVVNCGRPLLHASACDLLVVPEHDWPGEDANVLGVRGYPHGLSPLALRQLAPVAAELYGHMPRPILALLVGGPRYAGEMQPATAHRLGRNLAALAHAEGGSVLAMSTRHTGAEAADALDAGLMPVIHMLHRAGEPGPDPLPGFLAIADAVVVTADLSDALVAATVTTGAVLATMPELAGKRAQRVLASLMAADEVRWLGKRLRRWERTPLDEAGRVAQEIHRRFPLE